MTQTKAELISEMINLKAKNHALQAELARLRKFRDLWQERFDAIAQARTTSSFSKMLDVGDIDRRAAYLLKKESE